jgi:DNA-binding GntR family transcriptional regulator
VGPRVRSGVRYHADSSPAPGEMEATHVEAGIEVSGAHGNGDRSINEVVSQLAARHKTIGEMVYDVIREAIVSGSFAPGERLRQEALAEAIGVSRIPVRSALIQLESEGLVRFQPRRGAVVTSLSPEQIRETYELRFILESHALRRSITTMTPERVEKLRKMAQQLDQLQEGSEFVDLRVDFYRELYDGENNPLLMKLIEDLRTSVGRYLLGWRLAGNHHAGHTAFVDHVAAGDVDGAVEELRAHLESVRIGLVRLIETEDEPPTRRKGQQR